MKLQNSIALATLATLTGATAASAGTAGVTNSYQNRTIYGGHSRSVINVNGYKEYSQINQLDAIKAESYGGDVNTVVANFDGKKLTARATSSNNVPIDPVSIVTVSSQYETVTGYENFSVKTVDSYRFSGTDYVHSVEAYTR